ncbi:MAG: hypothetical protein QM817_21255 [Archangium sp.]
MTTAPANTLEEVQPGIWLLRFASKDTMTGAACEPLVPALAKACQSGPIMLLAVIPKDVTLVPPSLAPFWLDAMLRKGVKVRAIGVSSTSRAVRVAVNAFQAAMKLSRVEIGAAIFPTEAELVAWARKH